MKNPDRGYPVVNRRDFLKITGGTAVGLGLAACGGSQAPSAVSGATKNVVYKGEVFNAKGATLKLAMWGGPYQQYVDQLVLKKFEKDFNCNISYDSAFPWFPKFAANGVKNPAYDVANWNLPDLFQTARAGDYFVPITELKANVPNAKDLWPFASANGHGLTYAWSQYGFAYRKDKVPAPQHFTDFWKSVYAGKRATYITANTLQMVFFMVASDAFGGSVENISAGLSAMRKAMPMLVSDFTGNMQASLARGEANIAVLDDGEAYNSIDKGVPLGFYYWSTKKPILTQTLTVSKYSGTVQKRLAYALVNRICSPTFMEKFGALEYYHPTNKLATMPSVLAKRGLKNTSEATSGLWIPPWNWYLDNEQKITAQVDQIFGK